MAAAGTIRGKEKEAVIATALKLGYIVNRSESCIKLEGCSETFVIWNDGTAQRKTATVPVVYHQSWQLEEALG